MQVIMISVFPCFLLSKILGSHAKYLIRVAVTAEQWSRCCGSMCVVLLAVFLLLTCGQGTPVPL